MNKFVVCKDVRGERTSVNKSLLVKMFVYKTFICVESIRLCRRGFHSLFMIVYPPYKAYDDALSLFEFSLQLYSFSNLTVALLA